jgi:Tat protein secretion system quality control protein TatD with DNase activity
MVYSVIEIIAQIRQLSIDDVASQLRENAYDIYGV